jgi:hypothetical protein
MKSEAYSLCSRYPHLVYGGAGRPRIGNPPAREDLVRRLAGRQDAHAHLLPMELARLRTLQSFHNRLVAALKQVRVVGPTDAPMGFCITKGSEL